MRKLFTLAEIVGCDQYDDWRYVIDGKGGANGRGSQEAKAAPPLSDVSLAPFTCDDIATIEHAQADNYGENEPTLWCWGSLKDGRWFMASGWADYTGWG